jgi:hypothetical protein
MAHTDSNVYRAGMPHTLMVPAVADIERIAAQADPIVRNHEITNCYHALSAAMCERMGSAANWCTFATWASRQAGSTIRGEDLEHSLQQRLRLSPVVTQLARPQADAILRVIKDQAPLQRAAQAVARGNLKVFAEIAREFARFLAADSVNGFVATLRPGPPPEGQQLLRNAFAAYHEAAQLTDSMQRAQRILYANMLIGFHEQTRLQPEIREALDLARHELERLRPLIMKQLLPSWWQRTRLILARLIKRKMPLDVLADRLIDEFAEEAREVLTAELMTLELPTGVLKLGQPMQQPFPASLGQLTYLPVSELVTRLQTNAARIAQRDRDWSDFDYRMHFIGNLFRCYQERAELLSAPVMPR